MNRQTQKGFTLIEVLLVIGLITVLAAIVIIAINPDRQFKQANDTQRWSNVNTILNAIHQYSVANKGKLPAGITTSELEICKTTGAVCTGLADLGVLIADETYIVSIPVDPGCPDGPPACDVSGYGVGYKVQKSSNGRVTVSAPQAALDTITVTR